MDCKLFSTESPQPEETTATENKQRGSILQLGTKSTLNLPNSTIMVIVIMRNVPLNQNGKKEQSFNLSPLTWRLQWILFHNRSHRISCQLTPETQIMVYVATIFPILVKGKVSFSKWTQLF